MVNDPVIRPAISWEEMALNGIGWVRVPMGTPRFPMIPGQFQWGLASLFAVGCLPGTTGHGGSQQRLAR